MSMTIRVCEERDLPYVAELLNELREVAETDMTFTAEGLRDLFKELERDDLYLNLVAELNGVVVGFASVIFYKTLYHKGGTALINELIVGRSFKGRGIGSALIERIKEEAIKRGMDEVEVGTEKDNLSAQSFYKKCGFDEEFVLLGMEF